MIGKMLISLAAAACLTAGSIVVAAAHGGGGGGHGGGGGTGALAALAAVMPVSAAWVLAVSSPWAIPEASAALPGRVPSASTTIDLASGIARSFATASRSLAVIRIPIITIAAIRACGRHGAGAGPMCATEIVCY